MKIKINFIININLITPLRLMNCMGKLENSQFMIMQLELCMIQFHLENYEKLIFHQFQMFHNAVVCKEINLEVK